MKLIADHNINAVLCTADGDYFFGKGIGKIGETFGEICFNTATTGYQEILTDPSYAGQIINFTFPHIGNVGCNSQDYENDIIYCKGLIIRDPITERSNFRGEINLNDWLIKNNLTGICGVDTRALTKNIRTKGARISLIYFAEQGAEIDTDKLIAKIASEPDLGGAELASTVSTKAIKKWQSKTIDLAKIEDYQKFSHGYKVAVIDYGIKANILNCLADYGFDLTIFPARSTYEEIMAHNPDGIFLSNGPGDPLATASYALPEIKKFLENQIPLFGICLGHQLLGLASGAKTEKMFQGHRGANHPVKNLLTGRVEITSQNHGFCISQDNLPNNVEITYISLFDKTIQGIRLKNTPAYSVQYHPESSPGPHDSRHLFKDFIELIKNNKKTFYV